MTNRGKILQEVEAGQRLELKAVADHSPIYKSCWTQFSFLVERRRAGVSLGLGQRTHSDSPNSPSTEHCEISRGSAPWMTFERTSWCQQESRRGILEPTRQAIHSTHRSKSVFSVVPGSRS